MKQTLSTTKLKTTLKVWDFNNPVEFLRVYYEERKAHSPSFSYAQWAEELGLKSRSFLRLLMVGKRNLTESVAHQFVQALKLNQLESSYFLHLVGLSRASTIRQREYHGQELTKLHSKFALKNHDIIEIPKKDLYNFFSSYRIPRLQVLLSQPEVEKTESNLAQILNIKESEIHEYLKTLEKLGLARKDENNQWQAKQTQLQAPDQLGNIALQSFHRKSLEEAIQAIDLPVESRRFQSLVLALSEEGFKQVHSELTQFLEQLLKKAEALKSEQNKIYQINLNLIPVTGPIIHDPKNREPLERDHKMKGTIP